MSDLSDFENDILSGSADVPGSSSPTSSTSLSSTGEATAPRNRTPDHLSGISDVPSPSDPVTPISRGQEGATRLEEILQVGPGTRPDRRFIEELNGVAQAQLAPVVDLTADGGDALEKAAFKPAHPTEKTPRADTEMVDLVSDRPVYTVDYFTSTVTPRYLAVLREEFRIPGEVDLVVPGEDDLPSRPPPGYIALSTEYFRAGLRLPFHPYLRRALTRLNGLPESIQDEVGSIVLGVLLFPRHQGDVHHVVLGLQQVVQAPVVLCRRGYVWTRAPHILELTLERVEALRELSNPERNQHGLLSLSSLEEHKWFGSSSTSGHLNDQPRTSRPGEVIIARMPEPAVHYRSQTSVTNAATTPDRSGVPRGVPAAIVHDPQSGDSSPGAWGSRVTDEDMDLVIRGLFPARGLRIEGRQLFKVSVWSASLSTNQLFYFCCRTDVRPSTAWDQASERGGELSPTTKDGQSRSSRPRDDRLVVATPAPQSHREDPRPRDVPTSGAELSRQKSVHKALVSKFGERLTFEVAESSKHSNPVAAFGDCANKLIEALCLAFSGSAAARGYANRMADAVKSAETKAQSARHAKKDAKAAKDAAKEAQKKAEDRAKSAGERARSTEERARSTEEWARNAEKDASDAEIARCGMEEALRKAQNDLSSARAEHDRYTKIVLPAVLEEARAWAVEDFLQSEEFNSCLVAEYQEGIWDMNAGFTAANPWVVGVNWSFVPEESKETTVEEVQDEGEVSGAPRVPEDVVVLDDPEQSAATEQPTNEQPTTPVLDVSASDFTLPDQLD
ncbi:hypothetical protein TIFTF001_017071 [Ficus carica]|uniref:Uncharacterized protein n=1 Tax=Ficus carica TaxID=3494 RepID=A0AA88A8K9_FICCA|nr:hypothetical protein TIFTF001_017071 [Ficus carica]